MRSAHGRARELGRLVVNECTPADELPPARGGQTVVPERSPDGRFLPGNRIARSQVGRIHPGGTLALLLPKEPAWKSARRWGLRSAAHRIREMGTFHGAELSSGVCRLLRSAARMAADAEYLSRRAAADDDIDMLRTAERLDAGARQAERDAWELAARESAARPKRGNPMLAAIEAAGSAVDPELEVNAPPAGEKAEP